MAKSATTAGPDAADGRPKPPYLGLLNAIAVGEARGGRVLGAWAEATGDKKLAKVLKLVAAREMDHHELFAARIAELGFTVREPEQDDGGERALAFYGSDVSDKKKVKRSRGQAQGGDVLAPLEDRVRNDPHLDTVTRHLLQWFLAEERDSGRRLRKAYGRLDKK